MNIFTRGLLELQEMALLVGRAAAGLFRKPRYVPETLAQMDSIGVGSMTIIMLTGFFTGGVLTLQTYQTLASYGAVDQLGYLVSVSLIRELGPTLTALMVTGRVVSAITAELGSMVVSEQVDAMRALGTDPLKKLVWPRLLALMIMCPALTVLADMVGSVGGWAVASSLMGVPSSVYVRSAKDALTYNDLIGGLVKPVMFGFIIATVSCRAGLRTHGGTVGVGRSTTQSVVLSDILLLASDFFLQKIIQAFS